MEQSTSANGARIPGAKSVPVSDIGWRRLFYEGGKLLMISPGIIALYVLIFLASGFAAIAAPVYYGKVINFLNYHSDAQGQSAGQSAGNRRQEQVSMSSGEKSGAPTSGTPWGLYALWAILALGTLVVDIPKNWLTSRMDISMSNKLREKVFDRALRQDPEFFQSNQPGTLNMVLNTMTLETQMTLRRLLVDPPLQLLMLATTGVVVIQQFSRLHGNIMVPGLSREIPATWLPAFVLVAALFFPLFIVRMGKNIRASGRDIQQANQALASLVTGVERSPEEIQLMKAETFFSEKHRSNLLQSLRARLKAQLTSGTVNAAGQFPTFFIKLLFLAIGIVLALQQRGASSVGNIVAVVLLAEQVMAPISALSSCLLMVSQSWPSMETVFNLMDRKARSDSDLESVSEEELAAPTLEARNVRFAYGAGLPPVFDGLTLTFAERKRTALIARMGQGKTTLFRLALRFYDPSGGEIRIGGKRSTDWSHAGIRQHIGMMSQFPAFFHDTLRENLRIAKPGATDEELTRLCRTTGMSEILEERGLTLDTPLAGGDMLSGGQKKLLALTRCLLRSPSILFLDEPTAGVDNTEKFKLLDMLARATAGRTVVVVDHDVNWLLQFCDEFVGLENARVVEHGTLDDVLKKRGLIYHLYTVAQGPKIAEISRAITGSDREIVQEHETGTLHI